MHEAARSAKLTSCNGLIEVLDCFFLAGNRVALLMMQPAQLLKDLCVLRITLQHPLVGLLSAVILPQRQDQESREPTWKCMVDLRLSAVRGRDRFGTKCPLPLKA